MTKKTKHGFGTYSPDYGKPPHGIATAVADSMQGSIEYRVTGWTTVDGTPHEYFGADLSAAQQKQHEATTRGVFCYVEWRRGGNTWRRY